MKPRTKKPKKARTKNGRSGASVPCAARSRFRLAAGPAESTAGSAPSGSFHKWRGVRPSDDGCRLPRRYGCRCHDRSSAAAAAAAAAGGGRPRACRRSTSLPFRCGLLCGRLHSHELQQRPRDWSMSDSTADAASLLASPPLQITTAALLPPSPSPPLLPSFRLSSPSPSPLSSREMATHRSSA